MIDLTHFGIARAYAVCMAAHEAVGQRRKYTGEPYWAHPVEVAHILIERSGKATPVMVMAALLHDVVEDTGVSLATIHSLFGRRVARLVSDLTDVSKPEHGNRAARKAIDRAHTAMGSPDAKTVKLADLVSNTCSIVQHDPEFARVYLEEKAQLLEVMRDADWLMRELALSTLRIAQVGLRATR